MQKVRVNGQRAGHGSANCFYSYTVLIKYIHTENSVESQTKFNLVATRYGIDDRGAAVREQMEARIFLYVIQTGSGAQPIQSLPETLSLGIKRQGREADYSPPASTKIKKTWIYASSLLYVFKAWRLNANMDNCTLYNN
jgi:hypothetical protein